MSTEYTVAADPTCENPAHVKTLTVGLSAGGWKMLLQAYPEGGEGHPPLRSWAEWKVWLEGRTIWTEYGAPLTLEQFTEYVEDPHGSTRLGGKAICHVAPTPEEILVGYGNWYHPRDEDYHDDEGYDLTRRKIG